MPSGKKSSSNHSGFNSGYLDPRQLDGKNDKERKNSFHEQARNEKHHAREDSIRKKEKTSKKFVY